MPQCEECSARFIELAECPAEITTEWTCPTCGPQKFHKNKSELPPSSCANAIIGIGIILSGLAIALSIVTR